MIVLSLYDYTGEAVRPWSEAGYECYCFDIQHREGGRTDGNIHFVKADLHDHDVLHGIVATFHDKDVRFLMGWPVCTDMAVSGAAHFAKKRAADPDFQNKAASHAIMCSWVAEKLGVPWMVENPISVLSTLWRKSDHKFHPYEYGGYIPEGEYEHPIWPDYIAARDAYRKKTCLWTGNGFVMPQRKPVDPEGYHGNGYSTSMMKLGGKSERTKNIRSATPRGFARAIFHANNNPTQGDTTNA
jgi:hypothetical protein